MGSDRARISYDPRQEYRSVVMQQGRVTLEADWNEAQQIAGEELRRETRNLVGASGTPDDGYLVEPEQVLPGRGFDFTVERGIMYVDGIRAHLPWPVRYSAQQEWLDFAGDPDWVDLSTLEADPPENELVYLFLREQEVSAVEDPDLKDIALGGPDTAQRSRIVQRFVRVACEGADCASGLAAAQQKWAAEGLFQNPETLRLKSWAQLLVGFEDQASNGPCEPQATGGYVAPDNQLIRVQISGIDPDTNKPKFLWGFDNASFLYRVDIDPNNAQNLIFESAPVDSEHQPAVGQAVEILRGTAALPNGGIMAALSGFVVTLDQNYQPGTQSITLPEGVLLPPDYLGASQSPPAPLFLRVWQEEKTFDSGAATPLGDTGLTVTLRTTGGQPFHLGDYWMFAVRPATPRQVYPERYSSMFQFPEGPREWACALGVISWTETGGALASDCRNSFDNLVDLSKRLQGCCTVSVGPEDLISAGALQRIINRVATPTATISATTPGSAGSNITVTVQNLDRQANPPTFELVVTETDVYSALSIESISSVLGDQQNTGSRPGLAAVAAIGGNTTPSDQQITFSGGASGASAQADFVDSSGNNVFTLQAKSTGADGNLTTAIIANSGFAAPASFDVALIWTKTSTGITLASLAQRVRADLGYEIEVFDPPAAGSSFPAEGVTTLSGGADATGDNSAIAASGNIFGNPATICLRPGSYVLQRPLRLTAEQGNLTIEGCGGAVTISGSAAAADALGEGLIQLLGTRNVTLRGLTLVLASTPFFAGQQKLGGMTLRQVEQLDEVAMTRTQMAVGIRMVGAGAITVEDCTFRYPSVSTSQQMQFVAGVYANADCSAIRVERNAFLGSNQFNSVVDAANGTTLVFGYVQSASALFSSMAQDLSAFDGTLIPSTIDDIVFRGNRFTNLAFAVLLSVPVGVVTFEGNRIDSCLTGLSLSETTAVANIAFGANIFPAAPTQKTAHSFFSSALIQNSLAVPAAIPLPADYKPVRRLSLKKTAKAARGKVGVAAATVANPVLKQNELRPFAARMMQLTPSLTPGLAVVYGGPNPVLLQARIRVSGNDFNMIPGTVNYAIYFVLENSNQKIVQSGLVTITGNTATSSSTIPTVFLLGSGATAVVGNVFVNSQLAPTGAEGDCLWMLPATAAGSVTGNVIAGTTVLPARPAANPAWETYNDVR